MGDKRSPLSGETILSTDWDSCGGPVSLSLQTPDSGLSARESDVSGSALIGQWTGGGDLTRWLCSARMLL